MRWSIPTTSIRATIPTSFASLRTCWRGSKHAEEALLFPSGMAAIAALFRTLPNGGSIVVQSGIYWGTTKWLSDFSARRQISLHEVDAADPDALAAACAAHTPGIVFIETPSNPWLKTVDIAHAAQCAHAAGALLAVDSTAATPVLQRPLEFGADIVMHSATKGINGHSDVLAGVLATARPRQRSGPTSRQTVTTPARCWARSRPGCCCAACAPCPCGSSG
jgi:cystathionine beta-lyase/cystathionine gamma-synthase